MVLINSKDIATYIKSALPNTIVNTFRVVPNNYPVDGEVDVGIYISNVRPASRASTSAGFNENAKVYSAVDVFQIAYYTKQGDKNIEAVTNILEEMLWAYKPRVSPQTEVFPAGYYDRIFNSEQEYLTGDSIVIRYDYSLTRLSRKDL